MIVLRLTQFRHTLFGLPVALAGALLPFTNPGFRPSLSPFGWLWMVAAFLFARSAGMAFNQLIDRHFDAQNARTADRLLPTGQMNPVSVFLLACAFLLLFLCCCWMITPLLGQLAIIPALLILLYSYTKRFTHWCHFVLGAILACGPIFAYIAVTGTLHRAPLYLGLGLALSIAASDIIYARQDLSFDRKHGLHSVTYLPLVPLLQICALLAFFQVSIAATIALAIHYFLVDLSVWRIPADRPLPSLFFRSNARAALILFVGILGRVLWAHMF